MKKFDDELASLRSSVLDMGQLASEMLDAAASALAAGDTSETRSIYSNEQRMDQKQLDIDHEAVRLLTVYAPVATDLRLILAVTRITQELERIGDQAENMCEYLELIAGRDDVPLLSVIRKMAILVSEMLRDALTAFAEKDSELAMVVIRSDNRVDALNDQIVQEMLGSGNANGASRSISASLAVILIGRALERMADQSTNICEEVVYLTRGWDIRHADEQQEQQLGATT